MVFINLASRADAPIDGYVSEIIPRVGEKIYIGGHTYTVVKVTHMIKKNPICQNSLEQIHVNLE